MSSVVNPLQLSPGEAKLRGSYRFLLLMVLTFVIMAIVAVAQLKSTNGLQSSFLVLSMVHLTVLFVWLTVDRREDELDVLSPMMVVLLASLIHFVGPAAYNLIDLTLPTAVFAYLQAHISVGGFVVAFMLGFLAMAKRRLDSASAIPFNGRIVFLMSVAYVGVSLLATAYFIVRAGGIFNHLASLGLRMGVFEGKGVLLSFMTLSAPALILSYLLFVKKRGLLTLGWFAFVFAMAVFTGVMTGSRGGLAAVFLCLLIIRHYVVKPLTIVQSFLVVGVLAVFLVAFIALVRQPSLGEDLSRLSATELTTETLTILYGKGTFKEFNSIARVHEKFPVEHTYLNGTSLLAALTFPIPRAIMPDKLPGGSELFTRLVRPEIWSQGRGDRVTFIGELFMNFGWLGVFLGGLVLGVLVSGLYNAMLSYQGAVFYVALYAIGLVSFVSLIRGDFAIASFQFLRMAAPIALVVFLCGQFRFGAGQPGLPLAGSR